MRWGNRGKLILKRNSAFFLLKSFFNMKERCIKKKTTVPKDEEKELFGKLGKTDIIMIIGNWLLPFIENPDEMHPKV